KTKDGKFEAVIRDINERYEKGQPVLVGTIAVETSEYLATLLTRQGVPHNVLNAKEHAREAEIIKDAGQRGAVTIATNMAGRGVDIKIDDEVRALGGLYVLGTERHESRRIDNQLRGRSGRQGDPGETRFYLSGEDDLVRLFAGDRIKSIMERFKIPEDQPMEAKILTRQIEGAQKEDEFGFADEEHTLPIMRELERFVILQVVDVRWREHLENMDYLREGVHLRSMAQKDPLVEYTAEGERMFTELGRAIRAEVVLHLFHAEIAPEEAQQELLQPQANGNLQ